MAVPAIRRIVILGDPVNLGHNLGRLLAADVAGFAAGPAISAILVGPFGIRAPFLFVAGATILLSPFVARTRVAETVATSANGEDKPPRFAFDLLRIRPFAAAVTLGCAVWVMIGAFDALWSLALADLDTAEWLANLGITMFALPLVVLGSAGGRLAQRVGPFRVGSIGLLLGAGYMASYGFLPTGRRDVRRGHVPLDQRRAHGVGHRRGRRSRRPGRAPGRRPGRARRDPGAGGRRDRADHRRDLRTRRSRRRLLDRGRSDAGPDRGRRCCWPGPYRNLRGVTDDDLAPADPADPFVVPGADLTP